MKDARDSSAEKEATPLFVGGRAAKSKKRWGKLISIVVLALLVIGGIIAIWWFFIRVDPNYLDISKLDAGNTQVAKAQAVVSEPLPKEPKDQALYYGMVAAYLTSAKQYSYAERYYLTAQKIVDRHNLDKKEINFYQGLSDAYKGMGNKSKAEEYQRKAGEYMNDFFKGVEFNGTPR